MRIFLIFLDLPSERSIFSTCVREYDNTAIAEKREETPEILTPPISDNTIPHVHVNHPMDGSCLSRGHSVQSMTQNYTQKSGREVLDVPGPPAPKPSPAHFQGMQISLNIGFSSPYFPGNDVMQRGFGVNFLFWSGEL